jgi:hypothetical protein
MAAHGPYFDDIELLRVMLDLDERGELALTWGERLMELATGRPSDDAQRRAFVRELHVLKDDGLIDFVLGHLPARLAPPSPDSFAYLQNLRELRLRTAGRDRAKGQIVRVPFPDPEDDDGRHIPTRVVERFADAVAEDLRSAEIRSFLFDAGVPAKRLPDFAAGSDKALYARVVIVGLLDRGSSGRRVVRELIGRWLADALEIGPSREQREDFTRALARVRWHLKAGTLVVGEPLVVPADPVPGSLERVVQVCRRFHGVARELGRRRSGRPPLTIADEHDVQYLLHALLRIDFDDVRAESWSPPYLGGASRADFLLPEPGIVVEVKMTRPSLRDREVATQLADDIIRYGDPASNRGATTLVCVVYDPKQLLANPRGLEADLAQTSTERLRVVAVVT